MELNINRISTDSFLNFYLGIDDTDSREGMCTTYLGSKLFILLQNRSPMIIIDEFPFLIRLNPNVPYRTKGNGSVIIKGKIHPSFISWFKTIIVKIVLQLSHLDGPTTNPGIVLWFGEISKELIEFGKRALWDIIAENDLDPFFYMKNVFLYYPKRKLGLIGSLAGIGLSNDMRDFTFELLHYRYPPYNEDRNPNKDIIWKVNENEFNLYNCIDFKNKSIKIFPKGLDPVFCGIRGENPSELLLYWEKIQPQPKTELWMIFKTNQGTDSHLLTTPINSLSHKLCIPFRVVNFIGNVYSTPITEIGGHTSFYIKDKDSQIQIKCYAYEPTKEFRKDVQKLIINDEIQIAGNIRPADLDKKFENVLNIEKIQILNLEKKIIMKNPLCPSCNKRMESAGKNQTFRCKKCKTSIEKTNREIHTQTRNLFIGQTLLPDIDAQRHLTRPLKRKNLNKFNNKLEIITILSQISKQTL